MKFPDTDFLVLLVSYVSDKPIAQRVLFETGVGNKRSLLHIQGIANGVGEKMSQALFGYHAFTGCDSTSAFVRKGKVKPLKTLQRYPRFLKT